MNPGSVFFDSDFQFHDGESGEKLFVVLGTKNGISVVAKTTSKYYGKGIEYGCQPNDRFHNFHLPVNTCYLKKTTWVCLDEFYELNVGKVLQKRFNGTIRHICDIPYPIIREIQDCAVLSDDISSAQENIVIDSLVES